MSYVLEYKWKKDADWIRPIAAITYPNQEIAEQRAASLADTFGDWKFTFRVMPKEVGE